MVEVVVVNRGEVDCIFVFAFVSILEKEEKNYLPFAGQSDSRSDY